MSKRENRSLFEQLEPRLMMSGDVSVELLTTGDLKLTGDNLDNNIAIEVSGGNYTITGLDGTTIEGAGAWHGRGLTGDINCFMNGGDDTVNVGAISGSITTLPGKLFCQMGEGTNQVNIGSWRDRFGWFIRTGMIHTVGSVSIANQNGGGNVHIDGLECGGDLKANLGILSHPKSFVIEWKGHFPWTDPQTYPDIYGYDNTQGVYTERTNIIHGNLDIDTQRGDATILLSDLQVTGFTNIVTSSGNTRDNDYVQIQRAEFADNVSIRTYNGNDTVDIGNDIPHRGKNTFGGDLRIDAGGSYSHINVSNTSVTGSTTMMGGFCGYYTFGTMGYAETQDLIIDGYRIHLATGGMSTLFHSYPTVWGDMTVTTRAMESNDNLDLMNLCVMGETMIDLGDGYDDIDIRNCYFVGASIFDLGEATAHPCLGTGICIAESQGLTIYSSYFFKDTAFYGCDDVDRWSIERGHFWGEVEFDMGHGDDSLEISLSEFTKPTRIRTRGGSDYVKLVRNTFHDVVFLDGGLDPAGPFGTEFDKLDYLMYANTFLHSDPFIICFDEIV